MKKIKKLFLPLFFIIILLTILLYLDGVEKNIWLSIISFIVLMVFKTQVADFYHKIIALFKTSNWRRSQKELERAGKLHDDTLIRISFAYLFRIKINGKYFLVPNTRTEKYQPVGGAYKFYKNESIYLSDKFSAENDDFIRVDKITEMDYRLLIKNGDLVDFIKRFDKTIDRENIGNLSREFVEEIFTANILEKRGFGSLNYRYCGRHITDIKESAVGRFEVLLADIVEADLTEHQEKLFRDLMKNTSIKYHFATAKEIKSLGMDSSKQEYKDTIANHTFKILSENSNELSKKMKYKFKYKLPITVFL